MKILYVVHQFFPLFHTGSERLTLDTAKQMQRMGNFVSVLTYAPNPPLEKNQNQNTKGDEGFERLDKFLMKKEYQFGTIPVIAIKYTKHTLGFGIFDPNMENLMYEIVKKFDLIHFTHPMFFCSALKACKKLGIPTVLTISDTWLLSPRSLVTSNFQLCDGPNEGRKCMRDCHYGEEILTRYQDAKYFFENVDRVFASSKFGRQTFFENGWKRKMDVIHYSRDYSNVRIEDEPKEIVFGFMGSLIWHKGPDVLIKAFKKVQNEKIKLKLYGRGDSRDPYLKDITELAKNDHRIEFCGTFDHADLPKIMKQISVAVVPSSYKDNFPLVMQESFAHLKPVIGSRNGGIPEAVEDGVNGYLFSPGNVDQLTQIILRISENPQIINQLKKNIKPPPRIEAEALQYENVYRELTQTPPTGDSGHSTSSLQQKISKTREFEKGKSRLLLLSHNLNLEGATRWVYLLAKGLKKLDYDITVASPLNGALKEYYDNEGIEVIIDPRFNNEKEVDGEFFQQFDMIFLNTIVNSVFVEKIRKVGVSVALLIHESERDVYKSQGYKESSIKNASKVIFSANATRKVYADLEEDQNFRTINTALDIEAIESFKSKNDRDALRKKYGISSNDKVITIIGTIIPRKGQKTFAEAAIKLLESGKNNLRFFMVGAIETNYLNEIKEKIKQSKHQENIQIVPVTEPYDYYMISDVFVCTSLIESFPNVILEAMAFELPIISTDVFGIPEQIEDGKHGILIKPGDFDLLAEKIKFLLDNSDLAKQYAKNGYERIKSEITLQKAVSSYNSLIKENIRDSK